MGRAKQIRLPVLTRVKPFTPKAVHNAAAARLPKNSSPETDVSLRYKILGDRHKAASESFRTFATQGLANQAKVFGVAAGMTSSLMSSMLGDVGMGVIAGGLGGPKVGNFTPLPKVVFGLAAVAGLLSIVFENPQIVSLLTNDGGPYGDLLGIVALLPDFGMVVGGEKGKSGEVKALVKTLNDPDPLVRVAAAESLGKLGDGSAYRPLLETSLKDPRADVREAARISLGRLKDASRRVKDAKKALKESKKKRRPDKHKLQTLIADLGSKAKGFYANYRRVAAARDLGRLGDSRAVDDLIKALDHANDHVREAAAWSLGKIGHPKAARPLLEASLRDHNDDVREVASRSLGQLEKGGQNKSKTQPDL